MFFVIILVAVALCALVLYLPYAAGLTTVEKHKRRKDNAKAQTSGFHSSEYSGYIPPDEQLRLQNQQAEASKKGGLREKVKVTSEDMPIRIRLHQDGVLRKRGERSVGDTNPNNYDYDIDELIKEEIEEDQQKNAKDVYSSQELGGDKEAMV